MKKNKRWLKVEEALANLQGLSQDGKKKDKSFPSQPAPLSLALEELGEMSQKGVEKRKIHKLYRKMEKMKKKLENIEFKG